MESSSPPLHAAVIDSKLIASINKDAVLAFRARIVARGFQQWQPEDKYSLVSDITSLKMLLNIITVIGGHVNQMDVKTTFLNGNLDASEVIYTRHP